MRVTVDQFRRRNWSPPVLLRQHVGVWKVIGMDRTRDLHANCRTEDTGPGRDDLLVPLGGQLRPRSERAPEHEII